MSKSGAALAAADQLVELALLRDDADRRARNARLHAYHLRAIHSDAAERERLDLLELALLANAVQSAERASSAALDEMLAMNDLIGGLQCH